MRQLLKSPLKAMLAMAFATLSLASTGSAQENTWRVGKMSGETWVSNAGPQPVSLSAETLLKAGDSIRTGRTGRVLLVRGEETILISPNSAISIPGASANGLSTTIVQQAGSILLEVEKKNSPHFEVETPYLAAVVKGTQFRVSISNQRTSVEVLRGQVDVSDFKTGQHVLVLPGQSASALALGNHGLSLSGSGTLNPIEKGTPRASTVERVPVPRAGLSAPSGMLMRPVGSTRAALGGPERQKAAPAHRSIARIGQGLRISSPLGATKLDYHKVTAGLVRGKDVPANDLGRKDTVWKTGDMTPADAGGSVIASANSSTAGSPASSGGAAGSSASSSSSGANPSSVGAVVAGASSAGAGVDGLLSDLGVGNNGKAKSKGLALGLGNGNGNGLALALGHLKIKIK